MVLSTNNDNWDKMDDIFEKDVIEKHIIKTISHGSVINILIILLLLVILLNYGIIWLYNIINDIIYIFNNKLRKYRREYKKNKYIRKNALKDDISEYLTDNNRCLVCFNAIANMIYIPCKHIVICKECYYNFSVMDEYKNNCIFCRQKIEKIIC